LFCQHVNQVFIYLLVVIYYFCHRMNNNGFHSLLNNWEDWQGQARRLDPVRKCLIILFSFGDFVIYWTPSVWTLEYDDCTMQLVVSTINYWRIRWRISIVNLLLHINLTSMYQTMHAYSWYVLQTFVQTVRGVMDNYSLIRSFKNHFSHSLPNDSIRQNNFQVPKNQGVGLENQGVELCQTGP
jgi:hypothetical protein